MKSNHKYPFLPSFSVRSGRGYKKTNTHILCKYNVEHYILNQYCCSDYWLEIGFGNGDFIINKAIANPNIHFIGCEVYKRGIYSLLNKIIDLNIHNISIYHGDARSLLIDIPDHFLSTLVILFPDPWHKKKHRKRRLLNPYFFEITKNKIKDKMIIATDSENYAKFIQQSASNEFNSIECTRQLSKIIDLNTKYGIKTKEQDPFCFTIHNKKNSQ